MRTIARIVTGVTLSASLILSVPIARAGEMGYPMEAGECPGTVIVAARGNDSKDPHSATRYSEQSDFVSNGREGLNIRTFLQYTEARYAQAHQGTSLLKNTYVLGLMEEYYPADVAIPVVDSATDLGGLLPQFGELAVGAATSMRNTLEVGIPGARRAIEDYESTTGCTPQYILIGYSLGATVLSQQEAWLSEKGQLAGTLYMGNAHQVAGDPAVIGAVRSPGGLLSWLPQNSPATAGTPNRIQYCIPDDLVCDPTLTAVQRAIDETDGSPHTRYFLTPEEEVYIDEVADRFTSWIISHTPENIQG